MKSLDDSHQELKDAIPQQEQLDSDETSFKNNGRIHWMWCITSALVTEFHVAPTRARKVLEELVGAEFAGYLLTLSRTHVDRAGHRPKTETQFLQLPEVFHLQSSIEAKLNGLPAPSLANG